MLFVAGSATMLRCATLGLVLQQHCMRHASHNQDLLREMEVVENLGFEVAGSKEKLCWHSVAVSLKSVVDKRLSRARTGIERLREKFLGRGQADVVDEELLRQAVGCSAFTLDKAVSSCYAKS